MKTGSKLFWYVFVITICLNLTPLAIAQEMIDEEAEISFFELESLLNEYVTVASLFLEDELEVGSTVSSITAQDWKRMGARRMHEALANELSVLNCPTLAGNPAIAIRG